MRRQLVWQLQPVYFVITIGTLVAYAVGSSRLDAGGDLLLGLLLAALAGAGSLTVTRRWSRTLEALRLAAEQSAAGHLTERLPVPANNELGGLVEAVNEMAAQLHGRLRALRQQRSELESVLASMGEGVLAVDLDDRVLRLNGAAAAMFGSDPAVAVGRSLFEVVRHASLHALVRLTRETDGPRESDLTLRRDGREQHLQARATLLLDGAGQRLGVLLVLEDVTRLRRLEGVRQEFVGNVTHELRTPVTAIQGFVDTLLDGAIDEPDDARRFLAIIERHALRLEQLIEDLLTLARLEQHAAPAVDAAADEDLLTVLHAARGAVDFQANEKGVTVEVIGEPRRLPCNPRLIEAAVVNLIENAVKYSDRGGRVEVRLEPRDDGARISVRDWGCGIPGEHHARLFERFYRVDKARSRELGGTGLGLAIVKHIAQSHRGGVGVDSAPGAGSTFWIDLPGLPLPAK